MWIQDVQCFSMLCPCSLASSYSLLVVLCTTHHHSRTTSLAALPPKLQYRLLLPIYPTQQNEESDKQVLLLVCTSPVFTLLLPLETPGIIAGRRGGGQTEFPFCLCCPRHNKTKAQKLTVDDARLVEQGKDTLHDVIGPTNWHRYKHHPQSIIITLGLRRRHFTLARFP